MAWPLGVLTAGGGPRKAGAQIALEELSGVGAQAVGDYRTSVLGTAQVALAWASRAAVGQSTDPGVTRQIDLGELLAQRGTLYVISPSRIQQELAPLMDGLCAKAIDMAITSPEGRLERPLLLALDEVANIAPIRSLPRLLSEGIQQGIVPVGGAGDSEHAVLLRSISGNSPDGAKGSNLSRSLRRGLKVWVAFPLDGAARGVGEVARELGMSRTTVHRYVVALVEVGLLEVDRATRRYRISRNLRR